MATLVTDKGAPYIEDIWTVDDFHQVMEEYFEDEEFSEEDVLEAMEWVSLNFDANIGINWDVIVSAFQSVLDYQNKLERDD